MSDWLTNPENITESAGLGDAITATASPRPWRVEEPQCASAAFRMGLALMEDTPCAKS